jgi:serine/threonine protein kinase/tetratricopeptide (TPR) repeat protein
MLSPERWREISPYLDQALAMPEAERAAWLASLRTRNPELGGLLQNLLDDYRSLAEEKFLEEKRPAMPEPAGLAGRAVGVYTLLSQIGQGGMGSVWLAERNDGRFERRVAVKFLNVSLMGKLGEERFKREGSILGRLAHPNIADLIDAGVWQAGQPYLVLEYVEGQHIDQHCDRQHLNVKARVRLFLDVLAAVAHAHSNLIVHRDLKPPNILVRKDGQTKLLDFGIAKLLKGDQQQRDAPVHTMGRAMTPEYAAPEQLRGKAITTATDVYALGVLLYVLLTGQHPAGPRPYTAADLVKSIVDTEPKRPSEVVAPGGKNDDKLSSRNATERAVTAEKLSRVLRGDLDTIVAKALKKEPTERYSSVTAMADDLRRYLRNEPISARPDTLAYRTAKFVRRHRAAVALSTLAVLATVGGLVGTLLQARAARAQRDFAFGQLARAEATNDLNSFLLSDAAPSGKPFTVNELLARAEHIVERQKDKRDPRRVEALISLGNQYNVLDEQDKSRQLLQEAYDLSRGLKDPTIRARASCALASEVAFAGEHARAEGLAKAGLQELGSAPQFALDRVFCLERSGDVAGARGDVQQEIKQMQMAQQVLEKSLVKSELQESQVLMEVAAAYVGAGRYQEASAAFAQASERLTALGRDDTQTAVTLFNNRGNALIYAGRPLDAEADFRRALEISREGQTDDAASPMLLVNYARSLRELHRLDEAARYAERGYVKARVAGAEVVISQCLLLRALIYLDRQEVSRAEAMLDEVEPRLRKTVPAGHIAFGSLATDRALVAQERGDLETALQLANEAIAVGEAASRAGRLGGNYLPLFILRRSDIELQLHHPVQSETDAARALQLLRASLESTTFSSVVGRAYLALGRALQAEGKTEEARAAFRSAAENLQNTAGPGHPDTHSAQQLLRSLDR